MNTKSDCPDFPLSLALVDAIPVILFSISGIIIASLFKNTFFTIGICLCVVAGLGKVMWKFLITLVHKDYHFLNTQLRVLMPLGFLLMVIAVVCNVTKIDWSAVLAAVLSLPSLIFFIIGLCGMGAMFVFAAKRDDSLKSNWIEQGTNSIAQLMFLLGILLI